MSNFSAVIALSTCPSREVAETISRALISERLAACVNEIPGVTSTYSWQGELHRDTETLLVIKTQAEQLPAIERRLKELHPYELPEFIVVGVCGGSAPYLEWIRQNVGPLGPSSARES